MADIQVADKGGKGGKRVVKRSTRVDMTPMVDLGFLLITFFMLATTINKPYAMEMNMPAKAKTEEEKSVIKESRALTYIVGKNNKLYYYIGVETPMVDSVDFPPSSNVRKSIIDRQKAVAAQYGHKDSLVVVLKAQNQSLFKNMVDLVDEMKINGVTRFAIADYGKNDSLIINGIISK